jgi:nicotinate-nucleotide pyrophosphorylase (carboxylating)
MNNALYPLQYEETVRRALTEDLGWADLTTDAIVDPGRQAVGRVVARAAGRVAGLDVALSAFRMLDPAVEITKGSADGLDVPAGHLLATVRGEARPMLSAERTALNLLGLLCGIATATCDVVARVKGTKSRIVCTRKTTPGLRLLEKYAVRMGGGTNHRFGLGDAILIKDNHRMVAGGISEAVARVRQRASHIVKIEVEVESLAQLEQALECGVDAVLFDNMPVDMLRQAVERARGHVITEASGGITPENVRSVAETGVDLISLGWLTHSAPSLDVALDFD